jgi:MtN3 and saliva related transmembrane protein
MRMHSAGQHHHHVRKRVYKKLEPFPHPKALTRFLDHTMVFIATAGPIAALPQVFDTFFTKNVSGLSLMTWSLWTMLSGVWLLYGILHKETPIIVSNVLYIALQGLVVIAILIYG